MVSNRQQAARKISETHRLNLRKNIQHRIEVAREQGNENLVHALEAEANYVG
jgi:hypothetical protein